MLPFLRTDGGGSVITAFNNIMWGVLSDDDDLERGDCVCVRVRVCVCV